MNCKLVQRLMMELRDGALSAAEVARVHEHAGACEACGRELRRWERIREGFASLPRVNQPRSVVADVMRQAGERRGWAFGFTLHPVFKGAAAVAALAVIANVSGVFQRGPDADDLALPPLRHGVTVGAVDPMAGSQLAMLGREHAMFARSGAALDRNVWTVAATQASLALLEDEPVRAYGEL